MRAFDPLGKKDPNGPYITLFSGGRFYPTDPEASSLEIEDIAHALSLMPRFAGHNRRFVSVAQHSVEISISVPEKDALWGLLHDASEAYLMDLPAPIKHSGLVEDYRELEAETMAAIILRFGLAFSEPDSVRAADKACLSREWDHPDPWSPELAEERFLERYHRLTGRRR